LQYIVAMSWASIAKTAQEPPKQLAVDSKPESSVVVVDANAIINGLRVERLGERVVTTTSVLKEIRDQKSRYGFESERASGSESGRRFLGSFPFFSPPPPSPAYFMNTLRINFLLLFNCRAFLQTLPFGIETLEPSEESIKAVRKFATATGDSYSLSGMI